MSAELTNLLRQLHELETHPTPTRPPKKKNHPDLHKLYLAVRALIVDFPKGRWTVTTEQAPLRPLVDRFPGEHVEHRTAAMLTATIELSTDTVFWNRVLTLTQSKTEAARARMGVTHKSFPARRNERVRELSNLLLRAYEALPAATGPVAIPPAVPPTPVASADDPMPVAVPALDKDPVGDGDVLSPRLPRRDAWLSVISAFGSVIARFKMASRFLIRHPLRSLTSVALLAVITAVLVLSPWSPETPHRTAVLGSSGHPYNKYWSTAPAAYASDGLVEQLGVANVSTGAGYAASTNVSYDQVLKVQIWFSDNSGGNIYDVVPSIVLPHTPGGQQAITVTLKDAGGGSLTQTVSVVPNDPRINLEVEPDTITWKQGTEYHATPIKKLPDRVISDDAPLTSLKPSHSASLAFLLRAVIPGITVSLVGHSQISSSWANDFYSFPGGVIYYKATIGDDGDTPLSDLFFAASLPSSIHYVKGSARTHYSGGEVQPSGVLKLPSGAFGSDVSSVGVPLPTVPTGTFASILNGRPASLLPGETATITFRATLQPSASMNESYANKIEVTPLGDTAIPAKAIVRVEPQ
jgi:hypothetical protein